MFVPEGFEPPRRLDAPGLLLVPLGPEHNDRDFVAWTSSIAHIRATPGFPSRGDWPHEMSLADNLADLERHAADFASRVGFTFTVLDPATSDVVGCVYLYPADDGEHDVLASSWVRATHAHLDVALWQAVTAWLAEAWPWSRVKYAPR